MMRVAGAAVVACLILSMADTARGQEDRNAELDWAEGVLNDFFAAVGNPDAGGWASARSLMTQELRTEFREGGKTCRLWGGQRRRGLTKAPRVLAGQDEVVFEGEMISDEVRFVFKARVIKTGPRGPWRICYLWGKEKPMEDEPKSKPHAAPDTGR